MAELLDEMRRLQEGPQGSPQTDGLVDEMRRLNEPPTPAPAVGRFPGVGALPNPSAPFNPSEQPLGMIVDWLKAHPDQAVELAVQFVTTSMGMAAGAPAGPVGIAGGGAAGNVAGRGIAHDINRWTGRTPDTGPAEILSDRTAVDAGLGAIGAALQPLSRSLAGLSSQSRQVARASMDAGRPVTINPPNAVVSDTTRPGPVLRARDRPGQHLVGEEAGLRLHINLPEERTLGDLISKGGQWGAFATAIASGNLPGAAALLAGTTGAGRAANAAAERLLENPRFVSFILRNGRPGEAISRQELGVSLGAITAESWVTADQRAAIRQLQSAMGVNTVAAERNLLSNPERRTERRNPFSIVLTPRGERGRDPITGQWTSLE